MKFGIALLSAATALAFAAPATAGVGYNLGDAANQCNGNGHGLWTNDYRPGSGAGCRQFFSVESGTFVVNDNGTGAIQAFLINPAGVNATIDISLGGFTETLPDGSIYKREGGPGYNAVTDDPDIDFFTEAEGTITVGGMVFTIDATDPFRGDTLFQFGGDDGIGANAKNDELGLSSWLNIVGRNKHWDLNFDLVGQPFFIDVPAPGAALLFGIGGLMLAGARRKRAA
ncbi:MAG: PEP-CTERM sorting domain-containing protein [Pseudomonadota bacterium]